MSIGRYPMRTVMRTVLHRSGNLKSVMRYPVFFMFYPRLFLSLPRDESHRRLILAKLVEIRSQALSCPVAPCHMNVVSRPPPPKREPSSPMCWFLRIESIPLGFAARISRSVSRFQGRQGWAPSHSALPFVAFFSLACSSACTATKDFATRAPSDTSPNEAATRDVGGCGLRPEAALALASLAASDRLIGRNGAPSNGSTVCPAPCGAAVQLASGVPENTASESRANWRGAPGPPIRPCRSEGSAVIHSSRC
mmetsp:Transcript_6884/g.20946  ORF Transcript_6884/g.20946 Transcript_6884/m.20946 type:complete len:252 (-) Transcript_6884:991-1746(-)